MGRRRRRGRFEFRMRARVLSEPNVKPAEVPARVASPGVPTGRMPATEVAATGVASPASVLSFGGGEKTYHGQQDRKDVQGPHKEGSSSGHGPPTAGNVLTFYSCSPVRVVKLEETPGAGMDCASCTSRVARPADCVLAMAILPLENLLRHWTYKRFG